jgi:8-oxo-dGTP diphosphatase
MCSLLNEALHLNEHEAARWLSVNEFDTVNWLPADKILLVYIERELKAFIENEIAEEAEE